MKNEEITLKTKKAFAVVLKKLMANKPLSKITVSEIVGNCGVNRKTFYYHFEDIYALLKWMLEQEAIEVVRQFDLMADYEEAIVFVMDYVNENKHILNCAYDSMGRDELKRFFYNDFVGIMHTLIDAAEKIENCLVDKEYKDFVCDFYVEALAGTIINMLKERNTANQGKIVEFLVRIHKATLPHILESAE